MEQAQTEPTSPPPSPRGTAAVRVALLLGAAIAVICLVRLNVPALPAAIGRLLSPRGSVTGNPALFAWVDGLLVVVAAWALGRRALAMCGPRAWQPSSSEACDRWECRLVALVVGQMLLALITLGVGLLPGGLRWLPALVFGVLAVEVLAWFMRGRRVAQRSAAARSEEKRSRVRLKPGPRTGRRRSARIGLTLAALLPLGLSLLYTLTPAIESDELRYHLAAPAWWLGVGQIAYVPHQAFFNFPMLAEMQFMVAMALHGSIEAAKFQHWIMLPVCMALIAVLALFQMGPQLSHAAARRPAALICALAAGVAFALLPSVSVLAGWAFVDLFVTAIFLAFVLVGGRSLRAAAAPVHIDRDADLAPASDLTRWGCALGLLAAAGAGVKYTMLPLLGLLGLVWAVMLVRAVGVGRAWRAIAAAACMAVLFGGPWLLRNAAWTGNPVYPLAWGIFGGGEWSTANAAFYLGKAGEKGFQLAGLPALLARPLELLISPVTTLVYFDRFESHYLGPLPLMALLVLLAGRRVATGPRTWPSICLLVSWLLWFFSYQSNRMLMPTIALLLAQSAAVLAAVWPGFERLTRRLAAAAAIAGSLASLVVYLLIMGGPDRAMTVHQALGTMRAEDYLARRVGYWRGADWLNENLAPGARALLIGEHRTLYFKQNVIASDWFDTPQPLPWIRSTENNDALFAALHAAGVTHVLLNAGELSLYHDAYFRPRFTAEEYARFVAFMGDPRLKLVREFGAVGMPGAPARAGIRIYALGGQ